MNNNFHRYPMFLTSEYELKICFRMSNEMSQQAYIIEEIVTQNVLNARVAITPCLDLQTIMVSGSIPRRPPWTIRNYMHIK